MPYPQVTLETAAGKVITHEGACSTTPPAFGSLVWEQAADANYPDGAPTPSVSGATRIPVWQRQFGSALGNQQNAYLAATISRQYGDLVVIHAKAPTFPNNRRGVPPYQPSQLRYWSFCTYDTQGEAGFGCAADYDAAIRGGAYTYVVSDPRGAPGERECRARRDVAARGGTQWGAQIVFRNMLPSSSYRFAAQRITTPTQCAAKVMGAYYPTAVYCSTATFEAGGWKACQRAAKRGD